METVSASGRTDDRRIVVVGAGFMGPGIAQVFASGGHPVWLVDIREDALAVALDRIRANLGQMASYRLVDASEIEAAFGRVATTTDLEAACLDCDFVVEAVNENLALKQRIFADLDRLCPQAAILASNTSVISITEIASRAERRERIVGTHFWNQPHLIPLVEVVRARDTADWCVDATVELLRSVGKRPVRVHKDVPGFVGNRLQHALWREAFAIIDAGICDPETVDEVIRNGFGLRLPVLGPVENADMVGLDLTLAIHDYILKHLSASPEPSATLRAHVEARQLGFKTGEGFRRWSPEQIAASQQKLVDHLMKALAANLTP